MVLSSQTVVHPPRAQARGADPIPALATAVAEIVRIHGQDEPALCIAVAAALARAVRDPDWIPASLRVPSPAGYRRERLFEAADGSFSIGGFVWGPGQATPIHDHRSWGVVGAALNDLDSVSFFPAASGGLVAGPVERIAAGSCAWLHPEGGDIHRIGAAGDAISVSIHVYGCRFDTVCRRKYRADGTVLDS